MKARVVRAYTNSAFVLLLFLLLALSGVALYPLTNTNDDYQVLQQVNYQLGREELIIKDVLILEYRAETYHSMALSELQTELPMLLQIQNALLHGDKLLGVPSNEPDNIEAIIVASQIEFSPLYSALRIIVSNSDTKPDINQVNIVFQHDNKYLTTIFEISTLLQQNAESRKVLLVITDLIFILLLIIIDIIKHLLFTRIMVKKIFLEEELEKQHASGTSIH